MLFGNHNLVWKLQLRYVRLLVNFQSPQVMCIVVVFIVTIAFINTVFLLDDIFYFFCKPFSSMINVSCGIKLESIFKIVLFRMNTFSLTLVFTKALSQSNLAIARLIGSVFASYRNARCHENKVVDNEFPG